MLIENKTPQVVLLQELERWNKLVICMEESLHKLKKALAGEIGMSRDLDDLSSALYNGQLPALWRKLTPQVPLVDFYLHLLYHSKLGRC